MNDWFNSNRNLLRNHQFNKTQISIPTKDSITRFKDTPIQKHSNFKPGTWLVGFYSIPQRYPIGTKPSSFKSGEGYDMKIVIRKQDPTE